MLAERLRTAEKNTPQFVADRMPLMELMDSATGGRILYVHAPAGYGKTVSAKLWAERRQALTVVMTLEESDNSLSVFCRRFCAALMDSQPGNPLFAELTGHPAFDDAPDEFTVRALQAVLGHTNYTLVIDDLHRIVNRRVFRLLSVLFGRFPEGSRIVLLSRLPPPDDFAGHVLKESFALVTADDLRFSGEEIRRYFAECGRRLSQAQAEHVCAVTEGWAIGVNAVLLSGEMPVAGQRLEGRLDSILIGNVWRKWDDRLRMFMLKTALEEELTPPLCTALTGETGSAAILRNLVEENVFLSASDGRTYRFHSLFRGFLQHLLEREEALRMRQLSLAGQWYLEQRDYFKAAERFAACGNHDGIAFCFEKIERMRRGNLYLDKLVSLAHLALGGAVMEKHPFLYLMRSYLAFMEGCAEDMLHYADRFYAHQQRIIERNPEFSHKFMRVMDFRVPLRQLHQLVGASPEKPPSITSGASMTQHFPLFHRSFRDFSELSCGSIEQAVFPLGDTIGRMLGDEMPMLLHCLMGGLHYERGALEEAHSAALSANAKMRDDFTAETRFCVMMLLVHILDALRQHDHARMMLAETEEMIERTKSFFLSRNLSAYSTRRRLMDGNVDAAENWLESYAAGEGERLSFYRLYGHFTTARAHIVLGDYDQAARILKELLDLCVTYKRPLDVIEAQVLLAVACWNSKRGEKDQALRYLEEAVISAAGFGYTQVFANEGDALVNMLYRLQARAIRKNYTGKLPGNFTKMLHIRALEQARHAKGLTYGRQIQSVKYTDRQKKVMAFMCDGYNFREIADQLEIKYSTVRSHVKLIYQKLDVANESDAVTRIRALGILGKR